MNRLSFLLFLNTFFFSSLSLSEENQLGYLTYRQFDFFPSVNASLGYDSNVTREEENEVSTWYTKISPEIRVLTEVNGSPFQLGYRLTRGTYFSSSEDNFTDHYLSGRSKYEINDRNRVSGLIEYQDGHDQRGTAFSIGNGRNLDSPDQYKNSRAKFTYSYGAASSVGRLEALVQYRNVDYDGEEANFLVRDRDFLTLGGTFYYSVAPATDLTIDLSETDVSYDFAADPDNPLDSSRTNILVGVEWESTASTSGYVKLGHESKEFDASNREDFNGFDWEVNLDWTPLTYTNIAFSSGQDTNETNGPSDFIVRDYYDLTWSHTWLDRLETKVVIAYDTNEYKGDNNPRTDDSYSLNFTTEYDFLRWLKVAITITTEQRDSTLEGLDFDRNNIILNTTITL